MSDQRRPKWRHRQRAAAAMTLALASLLVLAAAAVALEPLLGSAPTTLLIIVGGALLGVVAFKLAGGPSTYDH